MASAPKATQPSIAYMRRTTIHSNGRSAAWRHMGPDRPSGYIDTNTWKPQYSACSNSVTTMVQCTNLITRPSPGW